MIVVDPKFNPNLTSDITSKTRLGCGVPMSKFIVGGANGWNTFNDFDYTQKLQIARNLYPQVELIKGCQRKFSAHRVDVTEGIYFPGENEVLGGVNQLKSEGRAVVYAVYNKEGEIDAAKTFDVAVYWKDYFKYDEIALYYDIYSPGVAGNVNIVVTMPTITADFNTSFSGKINTYYNDTLAFADELVEIML